MADKVDITSSIIAIAQEVTGTDSSLADHARSFLKLRDLLSDSSLNFTTLTGAHYLIWKCDLLHVLVEELRVDFTQVDVGNGWYTGVILGRLLSNVCSNIKPLERREGEEEEEEAERNEEFYEMLLPTAADSFLILANNIHESDNSSHSIYLDQFEAVTDALIRLCFAHNDCIKRVIESSYLLHLLVSDNVDYSLSIMRFLQELVKIDGEIIECVSTKILESILDELVYKVGGPHKELAITGLRLLAILSSYSVIVVELISEKYRGFSLLLEKWSQTSMDASMVKFVSTLLERVKASDEDSSLQKAAVFIQAGWRGYATRKRLQRMRKGFVLLQRLVRKRRRDKELKKHQNNGLRSREIRKMREEREHEMALLESMPASSVAKYLTDQKNSAAVIIQQWWKSKRRKREQVTGQLERNRSAVIIQRAYKKFIKRKNEPNQEARTSRQSINPVKSPDRTSLASMLDWFYTSRAEAREEERKRALLLAQLSSQCNLLLNMPSLADSTVGIETMFLSGSSQTVASMAEKAHSEKIASLSLPLWKRSHEKDRV